MFQLLTWVRFQPLEVGHHGGPAPAGSEPGGLVEADSFCDVLCLCHHLEYVCVSG